MRRKLQDLAPGAVFRTLCTQRDGVVLAWPEAGVRVELHESPNGVCRQETKTVCGAVVVEWVG